MAKNQKNEDFFDMNTNDKSKNITETVCEWASEQYMGTVSRVYAELLKNKSSDEIFVSEVAQRAKLQSMTVTACIWTHTNGKILRGARPFTDKIDKILCIIDQYHSVYGCSPTVREIHDNLNAALSTIKIALEVLVGLGCIDYRIGRSRSIKMKMSYKEGADLIEQINQAANTQIEKNKEEKEEKA